MSGPFDDWFNSLSRDERNALLKDGDLLRQWKCYFSQQEIPLSLDRESAIVGNSEKKEETPGYFLDGGDRADAAIQYSLEIARIARQGRLGIKER